MYTVTEDRMIHMKDINLIDQAVTLVSLWFFFFFFSLSWKSQLDSLKGNKQLLCLFVVFLIYYLCFENLTSENFFISYVVFRKIVII